MATLATSDLLNYCASNAGAVSLAEIRSLNKMKPAKPRCKAVTKSGNPCGAASTATGLCFFHSTPNMASELGRIGGRRNRRPMGENAHSAPKLAGASASARIESLYHDVEIGLIKPSVANVLIKLTDLHARVQEKTALEAEITKLQEQLRILKSMIDVRDFEASMSEVEGDEVEEREGEEDKV